MTKKDFELIAKAFRDAYETVPKVDTQARAGITIALVSIAMELEATHERFDYDRFISEASKAKFTPPDKLL